MLGWQPDYSGIHWNCSAGSKTTGVMLPTIICAYNVKSVIEIGIANGFTTQTIARGLEANGGGKLFSCDINKVCCDLCKQFINGKVEHETICCDSKEVNWKDYLEEVDLCYIDGDHTYERCKADIENILPLNPKLVVVHDYAGGQPGVVQAADELLNEWNKITIPERADTGDYATAIFQRVS
jgi:predicted O-methyltransferase YrrM